YCAACHQRDGRGDGSRYPPLRGEHWTDGTSDERLIRTILEGRQGGTVVDGVAYNDVMPGFDNVLDDLAIASIMTYIKTRFNDGTDPVRQEDVEAVRETLENGGP
ncbi:MAG: c-type cytochrome, partial [Bacteroidota bacterium]